MPSSSRISRCTGATKRLKRALKRRWDRWRRNTVAPVAATPEWQGVEALERRVLLSTVDGSIASLTEMYASKVGDELVMQAPLIADQNAAGDGQVNSPGMDVVAAAVTGSISNFVWDDVNGDGLQDVGEPGVDGVTVDLLQPGADGLMGTADDLFIVNTVTAGGGLYSFDGLADGDYFLLVSDLPAGYGLTLLTTITTCACPPCRRTLCLR